MSKQKRVVLILGIVLAFAIIAPYFFPETLIVRQSRQIKAPANVVFSQVNDLRFWELWSPWQPNNIPPDYGNAGVGRGGFVLWQQTAGESYDQRFTITTSNPHQLVEIAMDFPQQEFAVSRFDVTESNQITLLVWHMAIKTEGWKSVFFWLNQRQNMSKAATNLTVTSEMFFAQGMQLVERGLIDAFPYASIRRQVEWENLNDLMGEMYQQLTEAATMGNFTIIGHPFAIYHTIGDERVDIECGYPVEALVDMKGGIIHSSIYPETTCAITHFEGGFENLELGHTAVQQWMEERGLSLGGSPMEIYQSSFNDEGKETGWTTAIIYPF